MFLNFFLFIMVFLGFILSLTRCWRCLFILENVNVLLLQFSLLLGLWDSHALFIALMAVSTVEVIAGLVVLTGVWECTSSLDSFLGFTLLFLIPLLYSVGVGVFGSVVVVVGNVYFVLDSVPFYLVLLIFFVGLYSLFSTICRVGGMRSISFS